MALNLLFSRISTLKLSFKALDSDFKKGCFDLALKWAITGLFFRGHFRSLITRT